MIKFNLPNFYETLIKLDEKNGKYFLFVHEWENHKIEVSEQFYKAAIEEFSDEKEWIKIQETH